MQNIIIGTDSRGVNPKPYGWIANIDNKYNISTFLADYHTYLFTIFLMAESIQKMPKSDVAIIQSGWHEGIDSWPQNILKNICVKYYSEKGLVEKITGYQGQEEWRYVNPDEEKNAIEEIKKVVDNILFIGFHSIKNGSDLKKKEIKSHYIDSLAMNYRYSQLGDYLHMPMHYSWVVEHTTKDRIHYNDKGAKFISDYINRYLNRTGKTVNDYLINFDKKIIINDTSYDGKEFIEESKKVGSFIASITKENDTVLISKKTSKSQLQCIIGCILYNRIPIIVPHPSTKVSLENFRKKIKLVIDKCDSKLCYCNEEDKESFNKHIHTITKLEYHKVEKLPEQNPENTVVIQLSSGTTGTPKIIKISHKNIASHCKEYENHISLNSNDTIVSWLPLYHDMGLIATFFLPLISNVNFVHINNFSWLINPKSLFEQIEKYSGTFCWMPNFAFKLMSNLVSDKYDIKKCTFISCSEKTVPENIDSFIDKFHTKVDVCYALAENIFAVSHGKYENKLDNVSCGELLSGVSVIIKSQNEDVTEEKEGNVFIKSSWEPTIEDKKDEYGYYDTKDIGFFENGKLWIKGRADDMLINYGENFYPYELESSLSQINGIIEGRVCIVEAGAVLEYENVDNLETLKKEVKNECSKYNIFPKIYLVERGFIVKTSSGKINRKETSRKINSNFNK